MGFPNEALYRLRAEQLGVTDYVTFTGRVPYQQAPTYLALGDVAVSAKLSLTEGAGKLLNYMACDGSCVGEAHSGFADYAALAIPPFLLAYAVEASIRGLFCDAIVAHWLLPMAGRSGNGTRHHSSHHASRPASAPASSD